MRSTAKSPRLHLEFCGVDQLLVGASVTLVATLIAGFFGARFQAAREHQRWIREKRYEHVLRVLRVATRHHWEETNGRKIRDAQEAAAGLKVPTRRPQRHRRRLAEEIKRVQKDVGKLDVLGPRYLELLEAVHELEMIGPRRLGRLGTALVMSASPDADTDDRFASALAAFSDAAQEVIKAR